MPIKKRKNILKKNQYSHKYFKHERKASLSPQTYKIYKNGLKPLKKCNVLSKDIEKFEKMGNHSKNDVKINRNKKSFIICRSQPKSTRFTRLKNIAMNAKKENKIFAIYGSCKAVRDALLERGWVERIPPHRINMLKMQCSNFSNKKAIQSELERLLLSNIVENYPPNFIWYTRESRRDITFDTINDNTMINKLVAEAVWTSKRGLCSSFKRNHWFNIENIAEINCPRSYDVSDNSEIPDFENDFKITACTSLLKWVVSMEANDEPIFTNTGKISLQVILFALNRCKEYIFHKQNKDIDRAIRTVTENQWNSFLRKYYLIISKGAVFKSDTNNKVRLYISYAKFLLNEIYKYRPQLSSEGCHNIWIIKPAHCSRGRGIRMASNLAVISNLLSKGSKYVIQKYIEEPLLIYETKFDIRQYYLVTSTYPLVIWMYTDCYLKFSSQKYSLENYHESVHLTNNAVQRKYSNCKGRHADLPHNNMWDLEKYKTYLNDMGKDKVWENIIYPGMRKSIVSVMISCQDTLPASKKRFELYGCDFILDKEYKPWLIEINSCPDLNPTTQVTANICPAVLSDIIKVVIDYASNSKKPTGKFQCIYRQPMTLPKYGIAAELSVQGYSLPYNYFYKGHVNTKVLHNVSNIKHECDILSTFKHLKMLHNTDTIMVNPEEESDYGKQYNKYYATNKMKSDSKTSITTNAKIKSKDESISENSLATESPIIKICDSSKSINESLIFSQNIDTLKSII